MYRRFAVLALALANVCAAPAPAAERPAQRIVSLIPSLTEDLFALGAGSTVVGVSAYTDYPPAARRLPVIASFTSVDVERIVRLHPDLVVGIASQALLAADVRRAGLRTVLLRDDSYDDIFADLRTLGTLTGRTAQAAALIARVRAREAAIVRSVAHGARRPRVLVVLGVAPIFTVGRGSYIATLMERAGASNATADVRDPYARISAEALVARQPDALIVDPTVGFEGVRGKPPWSDLRAVREGRVWMLPDPAILERPGPRYVDGLAWLAARVRESR